VLFSKQRKNQANTLNRTNVLLAAREKI